MALALVGITEGSASAGSTTTGAVTRTWSASGNLAVFVNRWYNAQTITARTLAGESNPTAIDSETGNGTNNQTARSQWSYLAQLSGSGSKAYSSTYSASVANSTVAAFEISGHDTADPIGTHATGTGTGVTNPSISLVTEANNSAILACLMSSSSAATVGSGYTTAGFGSYWSYEFGEYTSTMDAGSAGSKTVNWSDSNTGNWHIDAIEVKAGGGGGGGATLRKNSLMRLGVGR